MKTQPKRSIRLPTHVIPIRYKIMLRPDLDNFTFYGEESIELLLNKPTKNITLHAAELEVESAEFIYRKKDVWAGKISYNEKEETVTFSFPKTLPQGKGELKLVFRGILNDKMRGFYRSKYMVNGNERYLATTQFEAVDARRAFPSFDEPAQKAVFDVTLMVPQGMTAISNTIPTVVSEHEGGYQAVRFSPTPRMSTYLLAFIVGDFEMIEGKTKKGVNVRVFTTPGKKHQATFALKCAIDCLEFYETYFAIAYPLPVLDLIAIPDFAYGAMENWGAVTYRESTILVDEELSSSANRQWVALVIAHELAHQWFGNLVTMKWWTHLWLNEGFASYIEYLAIDQLFPKWDIWTQFVFLEKGTALKLDGLKNTHAIEVPVFHPSEINEIFDKVSYSKGASVIRMLAEYLGEKDFRQGLRHYLKKHMYQNTNTQDLWLALEEVSGKPIRKIMANWTGKSGYPLIRAEEGKSGLTLSQSRFFSSAISRKYTKDRTLWHVPYSIQTAKSKKPKTALLSSKSASIPKPSNDSWYKINVGEGSFSRVDYSAKNLTRLQNPISRKTIPPVDRLGIIRDAFALSESGQLVTHEALSLATCYEKETDYTVWIELASSLRQVSNLIAYEPFYTKYEAYGRSIFSHIAKKVGWEKRQGEKHTDMLLRGLVLYSLGSYGDEETIERARLLFKKIQKGKPVDSDLRSVIYNLIASYGAEKEFRALYTLYQKEELQQEKDRIGHALGSFRSKKVLSKTLAFTLTNNVRPHAVIPIINSVWSNPFGRDVAWEFVKRNWVTVRERFGGGHLLSRLLQSAGEFTSVSFATDIEAFFKKNPVLEAQRSIAQAIEQIHANAYWLATNRKGIRAFLKHF